MAQGKHGRNNTIESRLLIKGGNLAELVPACRAPSANPDMSTSDLHHSSPQARINRALTPRKSLSLRTTVIWPCRPGGLFSDKHTVFREKLRRMLMHTHYPVSHEDGCTHAWAHARLFPDLLALPWRFPLRP